MSLADFLRGSFLLVIFIFLIMYNIFDYNAMFLKFYKNKKYKYLRSMTVGIYILR